jgi:hypothetical protein
VGGGGGAKKEKERYSRIVAGLQPTAVMEGSGDGGDTAEGAGAGFQWDADSQLYYHARSLPALLTVSFLAACSRVS